MKFVAIFSCLIASPLFAGTVSIDGQSFQCEGSIVANNSKMFCCPGEGGFSIAASRIICRSGKAPIDLGGGSSGVSTACGGAKTRTHANGGGIVDERATIPAGAFVAASATVCGKIRAEKDFRIEESATLYGTISIGKNVRIGKNASVNGNGEIGEGTTIEDDASINGNMLLKNATIKSGASLNGNLSIVGVSMSGSVACDGTGSLSCSQPGAGSNTSR